MATPASQEFNATPALIVANGATPAFKIIAGDHIRGGFEPLVGTLAVTGDLDGGTATLQIKVGGVWHSTSYILSAAVTAIIFGENEGIRASEFRVLVAGGGGSIAAMFYIAARSPMDFV